MGFALALSDEQWHLVADLFDPPGRRGAPARIARRQMVDAMLFVARTGCHWRYLPVLGEAADGPVPAVAEGQQRMCPAAHASAASVTQAHGRHGGR